MTENIVRKFVLTDERRAALKEIENKVKEARKLIEECESIAQANNVAFSFYGGVDEYDEETDTDNPYGYDGWQSSSC